jgi:DNA-binding Lrp family transcriptional regulator
MSDTTSGGFDDIDSRILRILADDPRAPYARIAERLDEEGYEMSTEGIRYRVSNLIDSTTTFFLLSPEDTSWEIVRLAVSVGDAPGDKGAAFEALSGMPFWHVTRGVGTYDLYAVGMGPTMRAVDDLVTSVRELDAVARVEYSVVTERHSDLDDYYVRDRLVGADDGDTRESGGDGSGADGPTGG